MGGSSVMRSDALPCTLIWIGKYANGVVGVEQGVHFHSHRLPKKTGFDGKTGRGEKGEMPHSIQIDWPVMNGDANKLSRLNRVHVAQNALHVLVWILSADAMISHARSSSCYACCTGLCAML